MENQITVGVENAQQTDQRLNNQQSPVSVEKPRQGIHYRVILLFVGLLVLLLGGTGMYFFNLNRSRNAETISEPKIPTIIPTIPATSIVPSLSNEIQHRFNKMLVVAHNELGLTLLKDINAHPSPDSQTNNENLFISPTSISLALSMAYHGARGNTQQEMEKVLGYSNIPLTVVNEENKKILQQLNQSKDVTLELTNSVWLNEHADDLQIIVNPQFITDNTNYYLAETKTLDFWQPNAHTVINSWVQEKTHNKIPDIIAPSINKETVMFIINAIYFKGLWAEEFQFDKSLTKNRQFFSDSKPITSIPMMKQENKFRYQENDQFQAVELPYGNTYGRFQMYIFLPKILLNRFIESLTIDNFDNWRNEFYSRKGTLVLPKFKLELTYDLKNSLERLGMQEAFSTKANFMGGIVLPGSFPVKISKVLHKTFIEVNEEGSEAAAATVIEMPRTGGGGEPPQPFYMEVNRPFVFMIEDGETNEILFLGAVRNLSNKQ